MNARPHRGFSLLEVVVSVFIIGMMLLLLQAIARSGALIHNSRNKTVALTIARNEIDVLRSGGYAALPSQTTFYDALVSSLPSATTTLSITAYNTTTKQVVVGVRWQEPGLTASSSLSLTTLITQNGGLP